MSKTYDIIVIGGGHNGLTAATSLAKKGKKVLLLEKNISLGGICAGREFWPGYKTNGLLHDTSGVRRSVIDNLELEKHGLQTTRKRTAFSILANDGRGVYLSSDVEAAANEISKISSKDGIAFREYQKFIDDIGKFLYPLLNEIPPNLMEFGAKELYVLAKKGLALKKLGKATMSELLKVAPMCVADFLNERFETEFIKAGIAGPAVYGSYTGPWSSYTTLNLFLWACCAKEQITGGPKALIEALEKAARAAGVEIRTHAEVESINLNKDGEVSGVSLINGTKEMAGIVASSCTPYQTFMKFFSPNEIEYSLEDGIRNYRSRGTTAKVTVALNQPVAFKFKSDHPIEFARTGHSIDDMEKAFDPVKYRRFSEHPFLDIHVPTVSDASLAPAGHSVLSMLVHFAPHHFDAGWNKEQKERLGDCVIETLGAYIENKKEDFVGIEVLSPVDLEQEYSLTNGQIFHGEHAIDQLITRPIPSCARYETPIPGLYLCGSGSYPGGGITCAPGALGAKMILRQ